MQRMQIALIGQPNVGKSSLFTRLTGVGVISSNYPGTTVEFEESTVIVDDKELNIHDLPGIYSLSTNSGEDLIVVDMLRDRTNDAVVVVADSTNLESSLVLAIEIIELGIPVILALNKMDLADKRFRINSEKLSEILGIPVAPVSSKTGEGVDGLLKLISSGKASVSEYRTRYDGHIMGYIESMMSIDGSLPWGSAVKMLEGLDDYRSMGRRYTYTFDGDDQLAELNEGIADLTDENRQYRRRIKLLKETQSRAEETE